MKSRTRGIELAIPVILSTISLSGNAAQAQLPIPLTTIFPEGAITLTWSSLPEKTYSVYRSENAMTWKIATGDVPLIADGTTIGADPAAPLLAPTVCRRFSRIRENR
jgi:hypothetical protein